MKTSKADYLEFIKSKRRVSKSCGFEIDIKSVNQKLFEFQKKIVKWAIAKGKAAIFADCGLGKTAMQLEWAHQLVINSAAKKILILAPLAVSHQTIREAKKFEIDGVKFCKTGHDMEDGISITNYEKIEHFENVEIDAVVLDESSILKSYSGKMKQYIMKRFENTPYKLACTATPSPNDHIEILNHSEFLNQLKSSEALAVWFVNDQSKAGSWVLKEHGKDDFWHWVSSWAVFVDNPISFGESIPGFNLPELNTKEIIFDVDITDCDDALFRTPVINATSYHAEKRQTIDQKIEIITDIINKNPDEIFCVWCETNLESERLTKAIKGSVEVKGNDSDLHKEQSAIDFVAGKIRVLVSKPSIFGFGLNFQICHNVIYCGLSFSYEGYYQSIRRFWRFGQSKPVNCYIVLGDTEKSILDAIHAKEKRYLEMKDNLSKYLLQYNEIIQGKEYRMDYTSKTQKGKNWMMMNGDCVDESGKIPNDTVDMAIFSPPFSNLYIYSDSYRDMGNTKDHKEFFRHFEFLIIELKRILKEGRICAVHVKNMAVYKNSSGYSGVHDFRGDIIRFFEKHDLHYHSEVTIWTDPVLEMQKTKTQRLLYKQLRTDASLTGIGLAEYLVLFRNWKGEGKNKTPITHDKETFQLETWQRYASPVWFDIQRTDVLTYRHVKDEKDEKHICPLQLGIIERAVELWSNPGEVVFSPFAGIGSEGYQSVKMGRKFIGIELKESYFNQACRNMKAVEDSSNQPDLFTNTDNN